MHSYSEAIKVNVRRRINTPNCQRVADNSVEPGIDVVTLYNCRKTWLLHGEVVPASQNPEGWDATVKFTLVVETAELNATQLSAYCRGFAQLVFLKQMEEGQDRRLLEQWITD
jgi:hypothetical protein